MMDPFNPRPGEMPKYEQQQWSQDEPSSGRELIWLLGVVAVVIGMVAVFASI